MNSRTKVLPSESPTYSGIDRLARHLLFRALDGLEHGTLSVTEPDGTVSEFAGATNTHLSGVIHIRDSKFFSRVLSGGGRGAGESYMSCEWDSEHLTSIFRIIALNRHIWKSLETGWAKLTLPASRLYHWANKNSRSQSRRNIAAHYDLGNDFFQLFLDPSMMYSCGIFENSTDTMEQASFRKNDTICQQLQLSPSDHVVEIGTGWGGFALHAAKHYGCRVTSTTISKEQFKLAKQRVHAAGLEKQITVLQEDYRDLTGSYDKLVSIEMIEAVGWEHYETYFKCCARLLNPDGLMLIQAITVPDWDFEGTKRSVDFIKRYVFPGGCLPSVAAMLAASRKATDLQLIQLEDIGAHYVHTLRAWRARFEANKGQVAQLGYDQRLIRLWRFYLCYSEAAFAERSTGNVHALFARPGYRDTMLC